MVTVFSKPVGDEYNAFADKQIANNLTTSTEGYVLDARQGKALNDKINKYQGTRNWISGADCNDYKNEGIYMLSDNLSNAPMTWFMLSVYAPRNDGITQIAFKTPSSSGGVYIRYYTTSWSAWQKLITNEDSGSQYIRRDGNNSYLEYRKIGNIVMVRAYHKVSSGTIAAWGNLFLTTSFPSEYRPKVEQVARCVSDRASSEGCALMVNANGNVYIAGRYTGASDTGDILQACVTYAI